MLYYLLKFVHVVAAMIWFGGFVLVVALNMRMARMADRAGAAALERQGQFLGARVFGPAAILTLLSVATLGVGGLGFPFWAIWGLVAVVLSILLGAVFLTRTGEELGRVLAQGDDQAPRIAALRRRLVRLSYLNGLVLLSAVWVMIAKPTL